MSNGKIKAGKLAYRTVYSIFWAAGLVYTIWNVRVNVHSFLKRSSTISLSESPTGKYQNQCHTTNSSYDSQR